MISSVPSSIKVLQVLHSYRGHICDILCQQHFTASGVTGLFRTCHRSKTNWWSICLSAAYYESVENERPRDISNFCSEMSWVIISDDHCAVPSICIDIIDRKEVGRFYCNIAIVSWQASLIGTSRTGTQRKNYLIDYYLAWTGRSGWAEFYQKFW